MQKENCMIAIVHVCVCVWASVFWKPSETFTTHQHAAARVDTTLSPLGSSSAGRNLTDIIASKSELVFTAAWAGRAKIAAWLEQGERVLRWLSGPFKMSGASQGSPAGRGAPIEEPNWASNLSPCHAAVLSTPLIQSLPCHGGTGRALIQFTQQQQKKAPDSFLTPRRALPASRCDTEWERWG